MISTNNTSECEKVLINVIKNIFCDEYKDNCEKCSLCHLIDINNLPSLVTISPDGNMIKKEQILELKEKFYKKSQYTKESIYIIKEAEKMNKESTNTMLKFLEEPPEGVIGFFITSHIDKILPTIQSRTQIIEVNFPNEEREFVQNEYFDYAMDFINYIESGSSLDLIYNKEYADKETFQKILNELLYIYRSELNTTKYKNVSKKITLIVEILQEISYNVNSSLLIDRFILEMEALNNASL